MSKTTSDRPGIQSLTEGISFVLTEGGFTQGRVTILNRESNIYQSTSPCEIVTCSLPDGQILKLLCKYSTQRDDDNDGHRGGIAYEGEVYRRILMASRLSTPMFYGTYTDETNGREWLVTEYLHDGFRITKSAEPDALFLAVQWLGRLHAEHEVHNSSDQAAFLRVYDTDYYRGWLSRAMLYTKHFQKLFPWLASLDRGLEECILSLTGISQTLIHGEYYAENILIRNRSIYPVDWESAAIGPGEIDLAALTEGWSENIKQKCRGVYRSVRWPVAEVQDFDRRMDAASIYLCLRWLGDTGATSDESALWYLEQLHSTAMRLGFIGTRNR